MTDKDATTPRVYLARHGETTWSKSGRYTGTTDLPLLPSGEAQVAATAHLLFGPGKLIDPANLARVFCSPRLRARRTLELLLLSRGDGGAAAEREMEGKGIERKTTVTVTEEIAEWGYGEYEGLTTGEIREGRMGRGLDREGEGGKWDIWRDGCEGGESAQEVSDRLDGLIEKIHEIQRPHLHDEVKADVLLVAHGHILRAFTKRWLKLPMETPLAMMIEPGGIGALSYAHNNIDEPSFLLGLALPTEKKAGSVP